MVAASMPEPITWGRLRDHSAKDPVMEMLCDQISNGFPPDKKLLRLELREYWQHRESLTQVDSVPLFKDRVIVPKALRDEVLETLHSAHQGVTGMPSQVSGGLESLHRSKREETNARIVFSTHPPSQVPHPNFYLSLNIHFSKWSLTTSRRRVTIIWLLQIGLVVGQLFCSAVGAQHHTLS